MFDVLAGVLLQPSEAFSSLRTQSRFWLATIVLMVSNLVPILSDVEGGVHSTSWLVATSLATVGGVLLLVVFIYLPLRVVGGAGGYSATYQVVALSSLPLLLGAPFVLLDVIMPKMGMELLYHGANLVFGVWAVVLAVVGIRTVHQIGTGLAILSLLMPFILLVLLVLLLVIVVGFVGLV